MILDTWKCKIPWWSFTRSKGFQNALRIFLNRGSTHPLTYYFIKIFAFLVPFGIIQEFEKTWRKHDLVNHSV